MKNDLSIKIADWCCDKELLMQVRTEVFVKEQQVPIDLELDSQDTQCIHIKAETTQHQVIGTARLLNDQSIGRMCVLNNHRNQGIGSAMLLFMIDLAQQKELPFVHLNAQLSAIGFYHKFGFKQDSEVFIEAGIDHIHMIRALT